MDLRRIDLHGTVLSITYPGAGEKPMVHVNLQYGRELIALTFQSRTTIAGLEIGQRVRVRGAIVNHAGMPTIFNPDYTIEGEAQ